MVDISVGPVFPEADFNQPGITRHQMSRDLLSNGSTFWEQLQAALVEIRQDAIQIAVDLRFFFKSD